MLDTKEELLAQIRLGEDSRLDWMPVIFQDRWMNRFVNPAGLSQET